MRWLGGLCLALLPVALGSCLERTNATPRPTVVKTDVKVPQWQYVTSFGGTAQLSVDSPDPFAKRYEDGKFLLLSGICATNTELWACDLEISRIQVFDHTGHLLRTIGSGTPLSGTLPTDVDFYKEYHTLNLQRDTKWEMTPPGQRWVNDKAGLFRAADVAVTDKGFWMTDQTLTSAFGEAKRFPDCRFYGNDGSMTDLPVDGHSFWPDYLAVSDEALAFGEEHGNVLWMVHYDQDAKRWDLKRPAQYTTAFLGVMEIYQNAQFSSHYPTLIAKVENAAASESGFHDIGGMAFYQGKLLVCDRQNRRIKIYEGRPDDPHWQQLIKIISANKVAGGMRFDSPRDIAISSDGVMYVLDGARREVAILSPNFERIGTIPGDHLEDPRAVSLSPDGQSLFISDPGSNQIHCYAAR